jgi:ubiquinone/menaquinone biosynthesis C-methylase UbiE
MPENLPGVYVAPNIQSAPEVYEIENQAVDPDGLIERAMAAILSWDNRVLLDLGAGTGFHVPRFHARASRVFAMEPHGPSRLRAMARVAALGLERASVLTGSAARIMLPDASVDIVHARFAYFFGPGCEPGLAELARVIRPGGAAYIIDNDPRTGTFAEWLRRVRTEHTPSPDTVEDFWAAQGFIHTRIASEWRFAHRTDLEAVVRLEFPPTVAEAITTEHTGMRVEYHYALYSRRY